MIKQLPQYVRKYVRIKEAEPKSAADDTIAFQILNRLNMS